MASTPDTVAALLSNLGAAGTGLAIAAVPVVAAIAAYVTQMASKGRIDALEGEQARLKAARDEALSKAEEKYAALDERYQAILRSGALIQTQLQAILAEAEDIAARVDAEDFAVLVPAPTSIPGDDPDHLVFLCASGDQAAKLKWVRVPIASSLSGEVYRSGQAMIATPPPSPAAFSRRTDKIADFKTTEALSICLRHRSQRVGVAQFLNKRGGRSFASEDRDRAQQLCAALSVRVTDFLADPRHLVEVGFAPRQDKLDATIMFIDLSGYSALFGVLDRSVITDMLNQYFQELGAIALRRGASIEQFIGDGALLTFNIAQRQDGHQSAALAAAQEMKTAFKALRERWTTVGYAGSGDLFLRIGLSCGSVTRAEVGHVHTARLTVIGQPVNAAARACQFAPRDRDTIVVTPAFKAKLPPDLAFKGLTTPNGEIFEAAT